MKNKLYIRQFYILAFISVATFKIGVLPSLLYRQAQSSSLLSMLIMMILEMFIFLILIEISSHGSILEVDIPISIKTPLLLLALLSLFIKLNIYLSEGSIFVKNYVFDEIGLLFVVVPMAICLLYVSSKGFTSIGKTAEIIIWFILVAIFFDIIFAKIESMDIKLDKMSISTSIVAIDEYIFWFGDFTPFLLITLTKPYGKNKYKVLFLIGIVLLPTLAMLFFIIMYKSAGVDIEYAFAKLAVYNRFSNIIGRFDLLTIISFLCAMFIKLSLIFVSIIEILNYFFKRKNIFGIILAIVISCLTILIFNNLTTTISIATSFIKYIVVSIEFLLPIVVFILQRYYKICSKTYSSNLSRMEYDKK